ncbi:hypothetical protein [Hymenobacter rubidus]|uniref:hypothetical protein n=1 Tax=Hymenobacter rubidus TaxID=1441626 RepID=UPI00191DA0D8|nr:hypothetical protein [Hymenobacter rubidus]
MKSLLKFSLLTALIISGKLAKQAAPATVAQTVKPQKPAQSSVVLVNQVYNAELAKPTQPSQRSGSGFITEMY